MPVRADYLPPFFHSERSLAAALRRLLSPGADRLASFQSVDWEKAFDWLRGRRRRSSDAFHDGKLTPHRLNVATSRAKALATLFAEPGNLRLKSQESN